MSVPKSDRIVEAVVSALDAIEAGTTPAGSSTTYNTTPTVEQAARASDDPSAGPRPWIGVVELPTQPPGTEGCFGTLYPKLQIALVCHVDATTPVGKKRALAALAEDIRAALYVGLDSRFGGLVIDMKIIQPMAGNAADPEVVDSGSSSGGIGSGEMRIEFEYEESTRLTAA